MPKYFVQFLSVTLAWTIFVSGSILPALHRHEGTSCCAPTAGDPPVQEVVSSRSASAGLCHDHPHATKVSDVETPQRTNGVCHGGCVAVAGPRSGDASESDDCSICRFLGQQRIVLSNAAELPAIDLIGPMSVVSSAEPQLRIWLEVRSRGPPTVS